MSAKRTAMWGIFAGLIGLAGSVGWGMMAAGDQDAAEELLPASAVIYARIDGGLQHLDAFEQTAAYASLYETGLIDLFRELFTLMTSKTDDGEEIQTVITHVNDYGFSLAISVEAAGNLPPAAWGVIVVPEAGEGVEIVARLLSNVPELPIEISDRKMVGRDVKYFMLPDAPVEVGWWAEGNHLMIAVGMNAVANALQVADGKRDNLTSHRLWETYGTAEQEFELTTLGWFDFARLKELFGEVRVPGPASQSEPATVNDFLAALGVDSLDHVAGLWGYRNEALWSEVIVNAPGERTGILSLLDQPSLTFDDIPALPWGQQGFAAVSFDTQGAIDTLVEVARNVLSHATEREQQKFEEAVQQFEQDVGIPLNELLAPLGSVNCLYTDSSQGALGLGMVGIVSVDDDKALLANLRKILSKIEKESRGDFRYRTVRENGHTKLFLEFPKAPFLTPTISIDKEWMVVGLIPQAVKAQLMRMYEDLFAFNLEEGLASELEFLPSEFTSVSVGNPVPTYQQMIGLAPVLFGFVEIGMKDSGQFPRNKRFPLTVDQIPPAELVTNPLFYNVSMSTVSEEGAHSYTRQSLPGVPLFGDSFGSGTSMSSVAVMTALLLPAVQQAREAARRAQSTNNLKQLALALHNYHDVYNHFPRGTVENATLPPEERLSWLVSVLPFLDQQALLNQVDQQQDWASPKNEQAVQTVLSAFVNPSLQLGSGVNFTGYVGIAGLGPEGPTLPVKSPRAGMFGYDRVTRIRDVTDGTSNTLMTSEVSSDLGPWAAGGKSTIRPFTEQPYLNGPDGFGGNHPGGVLMGLGDGSVRFISNDVDPSVIKAMATIAGGENVSGF